MATLYDDLTHTNLKPPKRKSDAKAQPEGKPKIFRKRRADESIVPAGDLFEDLVNLEQLVNEIWDDIQDFRRDTTDDLQDDDPEYQRKAVQKSRQAPPAQPKTTKILDAAFEVIRNPKMSSRISTEHKGRMRKVLMRISERAQAIAQRMT